MFQNISKTLIHCLFVLLSLSFANAQDSADKKSDISKNVDLSESMRETMAKHRLKAEEEEYKELIKKSEEAAKISEELTASYESAKQFSSDDVKKIDRLEKVVKKIRQDLGAEDDKESDETEKPSTLMTTLNNIKDKTSDLLKELKNTTRHGVSVFAIESSNALLKLVRFVKFLFLLD